MQHSLLLTLWVSFLKPATGLSTHATFPHIETVGKFVEGAQACDFLAIVFPP
jgi:hypothetical protein